ncbi:NAD-P-binding protein [Mycena epipterygia]|nr:NAD-P-binding protein [Mycena epipterygia]
MSSIPTVRKAIGINKPGDFDVLELITLPLTVGSSPSTDCLDLNLFLSLKVGGGDIVVKAEYLGINFIDTVSVGPPVQMLVSITKFVHSITGTSNPIFHPVYPILVNFSKGLYPLERFPAAIGTELSGTILALPTDQTVLEDPEYKRRGYTIGARVAVGGATVVGIHSDYASVPWKVVHVLPSSVSTRIGAAALSQGLTVLTFIEEAYTVKKGDIILVHTVAGGLGLLFAQLIKARGATVIGTTSTKAKAELAKAYGADHVILYKDEGTVQRVLELTNGVGVDAVFDGVGKDTFDSNFKMLKRKGTLVSVGNASGAVPPFSPIRLVEKNLKLLRPTVANYVVTPEELYHYSTELFALIANNTLRIQIHKEYPFTAQGSIQAQKDLTGGHTSGKLLIKIH